MNGFGSAYGGAYGELGRAGARGRRELDPFRKAGQREISYLERERNRLLDPGHYLRRLMRDYKTSPYAKSLMSKGTQQGLIAAGQTGLGGSSTAQRAITSAAGDIASKDLQNYLAKALGIEQMGLGTSKGLYGGGLGAAQSEASLETALAGPQASMMYGQQAAGPSFMSKLLGLGLGGGIGYLSGGGSGILEGIKDIGSLF